MNIELLLKSWQRRTTKKALLLICFLFNISFFSILHFVYNFLKDNSILSSLDAKIQFLYISPIIFLVLNLVIYSFWLYWRKLPSFKSKTIGILFAAHSDPELVDLISKIYQNVGHELQKRQIKDKLSYRLLPENIQVFNHSEANDILYNSGARLIIYGDVERGRLEGEGVEGFKTIHFTVRSRRLHKIEQEPVSRDIAAALAFRNFVSRDKNSFFEKNVVSENVAEVACFFIALGLTLDNQIDDAIEILFKLKADVDEKGITQPGKPHLRFFKNAIISCLTVALKAKLIETYETHLVDNITDRAYDKYAHECETILKHLIALNAKTSEFYLNQAIIYFHFGHLNKAWDAMKCAKKLSPKNEPAPYFSSAFLCLWSNRFKSALQFYTDADSCTYHSHGLIVQILLFLQAVLKNNPEKFQIKFALGYINDKFYDSDTAVADYTAFIKDAKNKGGQLEDINILVNYAGDRLVVLTKDISKT